MDERAYEVLVKLDLPHVRPITLADAETPELQRVKRTRTRGEYCWTITPLTPKMVFDRDGSARRVTYLDADMWFRGTPERIFSQLDRSAKAVLITEHAYPTEFNQSKASGRFCVQFVTFVRDLSEPVRSWWEDRCIEWCFSRTENGKFGDQMYLDDWPIRFADLVHVLAPPEWVQGPWNTTQFDPSAAICFHFHGLRIMRSASVLLTETYPIYRHTSEVLYQPYVRDLAQAVDTLGRIGLLARVQLDRPLWQQRLRVLAKSVYLASRGFVAAPTSRFTTLD
jgi:hypothetical protein